MRFFSPNNLHATEDGPQLSRLIASHRRSARRISIISRLTNTLFRELIQDPTSEGGGNDLVCIQYIVEYYVQEEVVRPSLLGGILNRFPETLPHGVRKDA
jgi:hypothetical protein